MTEILMAGLTLHRIASRSLDLGLVAMALAASCAASGLSREVLVASGLNSRRKSIAQNDIVVWVDPQSGGYHLKGRALYGGADGER
jgi:hypothetical protein